MGYKCCALKRQHIDIFHEFENRLLAVHLPVSAICVSKDIVVKKRNEWVISAVPLKDNTLIFFTNLKIIFKFLKTFFLNGSSFFSTDSIPESH